MTTATPADIVLLAGGYSEDLLATCARYGVLLRVNLNSSAPSALRLRDLTCYSLDSPHFLCARRTLGQAGPRRPLQSTNDRNKLLLKGDVLCILAGCIATRYRLLLSVQP